MSFYLYYQFKFFLICGMIKSMKKKFDFSIFSVPSFYEIINF